MEMESKHECGGDIYTESSSSLAAQYNAQCVGCGLIFVVNCRIKARYKVNSHSRSYSLISFATPIEGDLLVSLCCDHHCQLKLIRLH